MVDILQIKSVSQLHQFLGFEAPEHPLITIIRKWPNVDFDFSKIKITSDLYLLSMKGKIKGTTFQYGRNSYDFEEGTLVFMSPGQIVSFADPIEELDDSGWSIVFHPDLIRRSNLGRTIGDYSFFEYGVNEALHLSDKEKGFLIELVNTIQSEINQNIDKHSQELIIQNLETILKYSNRYYDRQFYTRTNFNQDYIGQFEQFLKDYFASEELRENGIPSLKRCGDALNLSGSYLSDLLKVETGKSAKDHIHTFLINKAKMILLNSNDSVSSVAYGLGFEYPQHFSKLFKSRTGMSPSEYRVMN
ncbi:MAG: helix-turn-helix transcriptional regulator [Crocinitomicaceae bacterium]|nr:helix-turn-helix transcriptional regulator [Crocinitomicaceae bacterium]